MNVCVGDALEIVRQILNATQNIYLDQLALGIVRFELVCFIERTVDLTGVKPDSDDSNLTRLDDLLKIEVLGFASGGGRAGQGDWYSREALASIG